MRHGLSKKKREKDGMPEKHDPKKKRKIGCIKVQEEKKETYNIIAMS